MLRFLGASRIWAALAMACSQAAFAASQIPEEVTKVRDPFKRPVSQVTREKPKSDLELFPVDKFKVVGIVTGPKKLRAMLLGPNGKSYFVAEGMAIGFRKGVIRKITSFAVQVREQVLNVLGQEENVDSEIKLAEEGRLVGEIREAPGGGRGDGSDKGGGKGGEKGGDKPPAPGTPPPGLGEPEVGGVGSGGAGKREGGSG